MLCVVTPDLAVERKDYYADELFPDFLRANPVSIFCVFGLAGNCQRHSLSLLSGFEYWQLSVSVWPYVGFFG